MKSQRKRALKINLNQIKRLEKRNIADIKVKLLLYPYFYILKI